MLTVSLEKTLYHQLLNNVRSAEETQQLSQDATDAYWQCTCVQVSVNYKGAQFVQALDCKHNGHLHAEQSMRPELMLHTCLTLHINLVFTHTYTRSRCIKIAVVLNTVPRAYVLCCNVLPSLEARQKPHQCELKCDTCDYSECH